MAITSFPPIDSADEFGILAVGGDLEVQTLVLAYRSGIFPWPILEERFLAWFSPPERAVLFLEEFRRNRSIKRALKRPGLEVRLNSDFTGVIKSCAAATNRRDGQGTWITPEMQRAYIKLHQAGFAHSVETYYDGVLCGGLYGVSVGKMFAGESMFYTAPDASKLAFTVFVDYLKRRGLTWLDCQVLNPFLETLGVKEIPRDDYLSLLTSAVEFEPLSLPKNEILFSGG